jgi:TPR repeat protein
LLERPCGRYTPVAQYSLGLCYQNGTGVDQDHTEAVRLYRLAADQGHALAQRNLGGCYDTGTGVDQDHAEAVRLYRLAADQGDSDAQFNLGRCFENGTGVDQDHAEAVRLYRLAADQGDAMRSSTSQDSTCRMSEHPPFPPRRHRYAINGCFPTSVN